MPEVVWQACPDTRLEAPGRPAAVLHKVAGCSRSTEADAGDVLKKLDEADAELHLVEELGKLGPRFLYQVRGWQRAGTLPATAASPSPATASGGRPTCAMVRRR